MREWFYYQARGNIGIQSVSHISGVLVPGSAVVELLEKSVCQDSAVLINKDLLTAIDTDQQTDDV